MGIRWEDRAKYMMAGWSGTSPNHDLVHVPSLELSDTLVLVRASVPEPVCLRAFRRLLGHVSVLARDRVPAGPATLPRTRRG